MEDSIRYSYSSLKDEEVCSARNFFASEVRAGRISKEQLSPSLKATFGSAIHKAIELRLKGRSDNSFKNAEDYVQKELEEINYTGWNTDEFNENHDTLERCLKNFEELLYKDLVQSLTDPEHQVELKLETPFRKGILVGKVDLTLPGIYADFKTGRIPTDFNILQNPQAGFYFYLAQRVGLEPPKEFVYVYLQGKNIAYRPPKKGSGPAVLDKENPSYRLSYPTFPTSESVEKLFKNYVIPLAIRYEQGIYVKNRSTMNCSGCKYRKICIDEDYPLPEIGE